MKESCCSLSRIKTKAVQNKRAILNTTINEKVLVDFKSYCKELGLPMNMIIESFMSQFVDGEFVLKIGKANRLNVDIEDTNNNEETEHD